MAGNEIRLTDGQLWTAQQFLDHYFGPSASGIPTPVAGPPGGTLIQGGFYRVTAYAGEFVLHDFYGNPYNIPIGGLLPYTCPTVPNSNFVFPFGQAISRATYLAYFALVGTTYGVGDGSTTFNISDFRGRVIAGKDDMGGSAASRMTSANGGIDGLTLGAAGGLETKTLLQAHLPAVAPTFTGSSGSVSVNSQGGVLSGTIQFN